jgi:hypothetical protein
VDFDLEMMESMQPLSWDADDIAFAREIIEEADGIMQDVHAGLEWINQNPAAPEVLQHNVRRIYKALAHQKDKQREPRVRLKWPAINPMQEHPISGLCHQQCQLR